MAFKPTCTQDELRASMSPERLEHDATVYQASRGGHFPVEEKPVPGTPQQQED